MAKLTNFLGLMNPERKVIMWYAVQVETGKESIIKNYCSKLVDRTTYNDIFVLRFNKVKKFYGKWQHENRYMRL